MKERILVQSEQDMPNASFEKERERLDELYDRQGITPEFIAERLALRSPVTVRLLVREEDELEEATAHHVDVMYANSSDPLGLLRKQVHVERKRVLTVTGSGDLLPLFKAAGAETVESFDVSWVAALWGELKLRAFQRLDFETLIKCFAWKGLRGREPKDQWHCLIDPEIYRDRLREVVSDRARLVFDGLLTGDPDKQISLRPADVDHDQPNQGVTRFRENDLLTQVIRSREELQQLQDQLRGVEYGFRWQPLDAAIAKRGIDVLYMSNIGYQPNQIMGYVHRALRQGIKKVYFTMTDHGLVNFVNRAEMKGDVIPIGYSIPGLSQAVFRGTPEATYVGWVTDPLDPIRGIRQSITARFCGHEPNVTCSSLFEISLRED